MSSRVISARFYSADRKVTVIQEYATTNETEE